MHIKFFFKWFDHFSDRITKLTGNPFAFLVALCFIIIWAVTGPLFNYSDTWQLVVNTGTTIITFLMVFLIQQSQNKDSEAVHLKLNELISAMDKASDFLIAIEDLSEEEIQIIKKYYEKLGRLSKEKAQLKSKYTEEEAIKRVNEKFKGG